MTSNNPKTPRQVQNAVGARPANVGGFIGALIWAALFGLITKNYFQLWLTLNTLQKMMSFLVILGSIGLFVIPLFRLGERYSKTQRESRANHPVQIEARVIESRLHWYGNPRQNFTPAWLLKYEFEFEHVTYQSTHFQFDHPDELIFGSVAAVKRMVATYPEGSTVPGYFRSTTPTASGLSLVAVTLEPSPKSYTEEQCRKQELLP